MKINHSPCMTCALRVSNYLKDKEDVARSAEIFLDFKRHHPKAFRVHDHTGTEDENTSWFCILGDSHFNKDNIKCPKWVPAIKSVSLSDAINLNLNRSMLLLTRAMLVLTVVGLINLIEPISKCVNHYFPSSKSVIQSTNQQKDNTGSENYQKTATQNNLPQDKGGSPVRVPALKSVPTITK